jgi:acyl dehydratase
MVRKHDFDLLATGMKWTSIRTNELIIRRNSRCFMPRILLWDSDSNLAHYTISEDEIVSFAKQNDPVSIHTDKEAAAKGPFGGLIGSGFNSLAVYQRLIVEAVWTQVAGIVGRSFEVRLSRPVRPGTCITGHSQIQSVTLRPERRDGVVIIRTKLTDGSGQTVLTLCI